MIDSDGVVWTYSQMRYAEFWERYPYIITVEAGEKLRAGQLVYLGSDGKAYEIVSVDSRGQLTLQLWRPWPWYRRLWDWACRAPRRVLRAVRRERT